VFDRADFDHELLKPPRTQREAMDAALDLAAEHGVQLAWHLMRNGLWCVTDSEGTTGVGRTLRRAATDWAQAREDQHARAALSGRSSRT